MTGILHGFQGQPPACAGSSAGLFPPSLFSSTPGESCLWGHDHWLFFTSYRRPDSIPWIPPPKNSLCRIHGTQQDNNSSSSLCQQPVTRKWTNDLLLNLSRLTLRTMLQDFTSKHPICLRKKELFGALHVFMYCKGGKMGCHNYQA